MTAAELTCQVLDLRNIHFDKNDYWSCWVVNEKEEIGETWVWDGYTSICRREECNRSKQGTGDVENAPLSR